jgi:hypothetical protein
MLLNPAKNKTGDAIKIDRLKRLTGNKTSFVINITDLNNFLKTFI